MVTADDLSAKLTASLSPTLLEVRDDSGGCGARFVVTIVSAKFEGLAPLARHRLVNAALKEELPLIHALSLSCKTPAQHAGAAAPAGSTV